MSSWRRDLSRRRVAALVVLTVATVAAAAALITSRDSQVRTDHGTVADPFRRPPTPSDRLPAWMSLGNEALATRRIALHARNGRKAGLYLARTRGRGLCIVLVASQAAGGSCYSRRPMITQAIRLMYGLGYASGIVRSDVRSVTVIGTRGRRHRLQVSPAGGFIYHCPAFGGCTASVRSIEAYSGDGRLLGSDSLPRPGG
jgi:hypothetical protein